MESCIDYVGDVCPNSQLQNLPILMKPHNTSTLKTRVKRKQKPKIITPDPKPNNPDQEKWETLIKNTI